MVYDVKAAAVAPVVAATSATTFANVGQQIDGDTTTAAFAATLPSAVLAASAAASSAAGASPKYVAKWVAGANAMTIVAPAGTTVQDDTGAYVAIYTMSALQSTRTWSYSTANTRYEAV